MHLFVLYLHPLLATLERVCGSDLVVAYADDISVITTSANKIQEMRDVFNRFGRISGAVLNLNKTTSIDVGLVNNNSIQVDWLRTEDSIRILGVVFTNSIRRMVALNWDALVGKITQQVWLHSLRTLTLHQKVTLLNTFITAKIWYLSSILPLNYVHTAKITATMGTPSSAEHSLSENNPANSFPFASPNPTESFLRSNPSVQHQPNRPTANRNPTSDSELETSVAKHR